MSIDQHGRLIVGEIDKKGVADPAKRPASGVILRVNANGSRTVLADEGIPQLTGVLVSAGGSLYASLFGTSPGNAKPAGEVVRIAKG